MRVVSTTVSVRNARVHAWIGRLGLLLLWLAAATVYAGMIHVSSEVGACWTPLGLLIGTSLFLGMRSGAFAGSAGALAPGSVTVEDGVIEVVAGQTRRRLRVEDLVGGWSEPDPSLGDETAVLVARDGTEVRFASPRTEQVEALLRASGVAPDQRAVRMRVAPGQSTAGRAFSIFATFVSVMLLLPSLSVTVWAVAALIAGEGISAAVAAALAGIFTIMFASTTRHFGRALFSTTLSVGTDGVVVERLFRRILLRRAEIVDVVARPDALVLRLASGRSVHIPASAAAAAAAASRIEEALRASLSSGAQLLRLDRGERPIPAWIADLRGLAGGSRGYREAALSREELIDLVKDGAAPAERRVGAAVALSGHRDEAARAALRIAADTCVDEKLRVVLGGAGEMDEEDLAKAIADATARR
jgi:hypothetical protein